MTTTATIPGALDQRMTALGRANRVREDGAQAKREMRVGLLSFAEALGDPRCGAIPAWRLMVEIPGWGNVKANKVLSRNGINPLRRVDSLTARQRGILVDEVGTSARLAA